MGTAPRDDLYVLAPALRPSAQPSSGEQQQSCPDASTSHPLLWPKTVDKSPPATYFSSASTQGPAHFLKRLHDKEGECPDRPQFLRSQGACLCEAKPPPSSAEIWSAGQLCGPACTLICLRQTPTEGGGMDELTPHAPSGLARAGHSPEMA